MTASRRVVVLMAILALIAASAGFLWWRDKAESSLQVNGARVTYKFAPLPADAPTLALGLFIQRPGDEIRLMEVKPRISPTVEFLGSFNVWPRDFHANKFSTDLGWPPSLVAPAARHALTEPVPATETAHIPGGEFTEPPPVQVTIGFRVRNGDIGVINGIEVVYLADGKKVRELFDYAVIACVKPRECGPPKGMNSDEWESQLFRRFGLLRNES